MSFRTTRAGVALLAGLSAIPAAQAASKAQLIVVHGLPGQDIGQPPSLPVDVLVNGSICLLKSFTFGTVTPPVSLEPGTYKVAISLANAATPCSNAAVIKASATLKGGTISAIVAALSPKNAPTADLFAIPPAPANGISFLNANASDGRATFKVADKAGNGYSLPLGPRRSGSASTSGGTATYTLSLATPTKIAGPFTFTLNKQSEELIFAVGSAKSGSLTALTSSVSAQ